MRLKLSNVPGGPPTKDQTFTQCFSCISWLPNAAIKLQWRFTSLTSALAASKTSSFLSWPNLAYIFLKATSFSLTVVTIYSAFYSPKFSLYHLFDYSPNVYLICQILYLISNPASNWAISGIGFAGYFNVSL